MRGSDFTTGAVRLLDSQWLTTADVAKMLGVTPRGVRWLAQERRLACERTRRGQALYRAGDIVRAVVQRAGARVQSRAELLAWLRPRMLRVGIEPRQLALFRKVKASERSLPQAEVKRPRLVQKSA